MTASTEDKRPFFIEDQPNIPTEMSDALDSDDPVAALKLLSQASAEKANSLAAQLSSQMESYDYKVSSTLTDRSHDHHPVNAALACSDSIFHSLSKIASGGSQASHELRELEQEKSDMEQHAAAVAMALRFRMDADHAAQALACERYMAAAEAVRAYLLWNNNQQEQEDIRQDDTTNTTVVDARVRLYAGESTLRQLADAAAQLQARVLALYQGSVEQGDLKAIGQLTPVFSVLQREQDAVKLYLQFLTLRVLEPAMQLDNNNDESSKERMARVVNVAVNCLRHHLPLVSHCLWRAHGDAAVVRLVHEHVGAALVPVVKRYQQDRLRAMQESSDRVYAALEERYQEDDCGFASLVGSLSDVDAAMEEAATCVQHLESYLRFIEHTCGEVTKARYLRQDDAANEEILSSSTPLHQSLAELGGQYAAIERCLLLASMQRAFAVSASDTPRYFRPLSMGATPHALQTSMVDTCLYASRRSTQRAFATGHTGTASAMTNFCVEILNDVLLEVLSHRAEEAGVAVLKPGDGLLVGSTGIFTATNLIRQGADVGRAVGRPPNERDVLLRKQQQKEGIAHACAALNDLEVAVAHTNQLETILMQAIEKGFPPEKRETEQLQMCVKTLNNITESFKVASNSTVESLESVLKPRIRAIVGEAVGGEGASAFMATSVMGGGKDANRVQVRMNYNIDDDIYNLMQLSEGYVARLCSLLDELLNPLRDFLAPRLWDNLLLIVMGTVSKRLETSLRKCEFTSLGALALDTDMRDLLNYAKEKLYSAEFSSNTGITRACPPLARLLQISKLLNVDDLDDVIDLISSSKRKNNWELKLEDTKAFLSARVEFESSKINELLKLRDDD
jgi:hypothetical protein